MITIRASTVEDFSAIELGAWEARVLGDRLPTVAKHWAGKAVTACEDDRVLGLLGLRETNDGAMLTLVMSDEIRRRPMWLCKQAKKGLKRIMSDNNLNTLLAEVHRDHEAGHRWVKWLGFKPVKTSGEKWRYAYGA